jgi:hypothetical protein
MLASAAIASSRDAVILSRAAAKNLAECVKIAPFKQDPSSLRDSG